MTAARTTATSLLGAAALMASAVALAAPASADVTETCQDGVLVVVDFTDLGGEVETGCAPGDPSSGREALELAGFEPVDGSFAGMVCTIDGQPDPCPEEFDGNFWAYWQVVDGEWVSSQVGLDEADPTPGGVEGWRYNDGSVPPPLPGADGAEGTDGTEDATASQDATGESAEPTTDATGDEVSAEATETATEAEASEGSGTSPALWIGIGVVVLAAVIGLVVRATGARAEKEASSSSEE